MADTLTVSSLRDQLVALRRAHPDPHPDAGVFLNGADYALRFEESLDFDQLALIERTILRGQQRLEGIARGHTPWRRRVGFTVRGFRSRVDGSPQPIGVMLPRNFDPAKKYRLDCVLHGSVGPRPLSYIRFLVWFDTGDEHGDHLRGLARPSIPDDPWIEINPFGRAETCYRFSGETDVFEAIDAACDDYPLDRDRVVLRGMSMGASGTWHIGLKNPDRFTALAPYAGYVDTHVFSRSPVGSFLRIDELPDHQERALTINDAYRYALNIGVIPTYAAIGAKDIFHDYAHPVMEKAVADEGLKLVNIVSPETGHVIDPVARAEQFKLVAQSIEPGTNHSPRKLRFITWTLKYGKCHWLQITGLGRHYERTVFDATLGDDGVLDVRETTNITRFVITPEAWASLPATTKRGVRIHGRAIDASKASGAIEFERRGDAWVVVDANGSSAGVRKRPGVQGPIDDAFMSAFLCVRGTGSPWNETIGRYAGASLRRFADEWARHWRAELPIKDDRDVTADDARERHLILFGDPGSNPWLARALPSLRHAGLEWTRERVTLGTHAGDARDHTPVLIQPSPFEGASGRYVVINSGHTCHHADVNRVNYLIYPRLGDWALLRVGGTTPTDPREPLDESVVAVGYCDETWRVTDR